MKAKQNKRGFTLIEMLLVMVIISIIIFASVSYVQQRALQMRIDRTTTQMQQILNAGLSFYVANGYWPTDLNTLKGIPSGTMYIPKALPSPWSGVEYTVANDGKLFYVYIPVKTVSGKSAFAISQVIAGSLPLPYTSNAPGSSGSPPPVGSACTVSDSTCYVVAAVNIPGYNLNNASAINFAGLYHNGGCVPVPECPVDQKGTTMKPQILVSPVQISGSNDPNSSNVYPISSFTAYAKGGTNNSPPACTAASISCPASTNPNQKYWRVCVQVVTERGVLDSTATLWGQKQSVMALTRCIIKNEVAGTPFTPIYGTD